MPAAAVIPAPIVYIRIDVVEMSVVQCLQEAVDPSSGCASVLPA